MVLQNWSFGLKDLKQHGDIQFVWGPRGLENALAASDIIVIVDVLSFSTCVDIAVGRGAQVYPYHLRGEKAQAYARAHGALLAGEEGSDHGFALSPGSLNSVPAGTRLVLPSPNGATLSMGTGSLLTLTACLRNAAAVARYARERGRRICVAAAGERWPDGSLRPCLEDMLGAGAVIQYLSGVLSAEARSALAAYQESVPALYERIRNSVSGRELADLGREHDVQLACELDCSRATPLLLEGAYLNATN
jgi:2-phosphosulfolactate phosphatase